MSRWWVALLLGMGGLALQASEMPATFIGMVEAHNRLRSPLGLPPLRWSPAAAEQAQANRLRSGLGRQPRQPRLPGALQPRPRTASALWRKRAARLRRRPLRGPVARSRIGGGTLGGRWSGHRSRDRRVPQPQRYPLRPVPRHRRTGDPGHRLRRRPLPQRRSLGLQLLPAQHADGGRERPAHHPVATGRARPPDGGRGGVCWRPFFWRGDAGCGFPRRWRWWRPQTPRP
jgi:hypothetical protein